MSAPLTAFLINFFIFTSSAVDVSVSSRSNQTNSSAAARILNVFNIVTFPNDPCVGTSLTGQYGSCLTASECSSLSGVSVGSCASGFGVCCTNYQGCGGTWNLNNSYWRDSKSMTGSTQSDETSPCTFKVCRTDSDIGQIRLDFETFSLAQPNTVYATGANGQGLGESRTQCQEAQFRANSKNSNPAPVLCGENSGYHMYLEAMDTCNTLTMSWLPTINIPTWSIKISQHSKTAWYRAPPHCTQYFTGTTGYLKSFNYDSGYHLANQNYQICIRTERNMCKIFYSAVSSTSFRISGTISGTGHTEAYYCSEDYIAIPFGTNPALPLSSSAPPAPSAAKPNRYCGALLTYSVAGTTEGTINTSVTPFR